MKNKICLDTGIVTQFYSENTPESILQLMKSVLEGKIEAYILAPILIEIFYHICVLRGKQSAETTVATFLNKYPVKLVNLDQTLIYKAGRLKCQHRNRLSYNDCYAIAYSLNNKLIFHTTEKELKEDLLNLKIVNHSFA